MYAGYQALIVLGELKAGDHVLIHAAASGVGIAAIPLAWLFGACVPRASARRRSD
jgi:NADPH:quinone reductase-like Zn-dependent oxidoreductase